MSNPTEDLARRIADCLEHDLPKYGFEPYRYPSGENKSVKMFEPGVISLFDAAGRAWEVEVRPRRRDNDLLDHPSMRCAIGQHGQCLLGAAGCPCPCPRTAEEAAFQELVDLTHEACLYAGCEGCEDGRHP